MDEILENTDIETGVEEMETETTQNQTYTQEELILNITERYLELVNNVRERYKYHPELSSSIEAGLRKFQEKLERNHDQILYTLSDNFLYCLEAVKDMNCDFFIYQTDRIKKKNGKIEKLEISKLIGRASMRTLLRECDDKMSRYVFTTLIEIFKSLTYKNEEDEHVFYDFYVNFVKENLHQSRNYSKMLVSIDNVKYILDENIEPISYDEANIESSSSESEDEKTSRRNKKKKNKSKNSNGFEDMFMKGLEKTKIAKLAKNISEKLSTDESSPLNNPMKLLSSLTGNGNSEDGDGGLGNLLKTIVGEVQTAMTQEGMDERELMGEAMNMMGTFKNLAGFDPMNIMKNMMGGREGGNNQGSGENETDEDVMKMFGITPENMNERTVSQNPDMAQLSGIFQNLNKTLGKEMRKIVEEQQQQQSEDGSVPVETQTEVSSSSPSMSLNEDVQEVEEQKVEETTTSIKKKSKKKKE